MTWAVEAQRGSAADFHARALPEPPTRAVWVFDVRRPAIVLGSAQPDAVVDADAAARAGVEVVRRRSGGGAVLLVPGDVLWVDVLLPAGDDLAQDDVGRAAWWVGETWARALEACGVPGATVHRGAMVRTSWSSVVCFDGLGPGEVLVPAGKAVGLSQRRTRAVARFQCAVHARWDPERLVELLAAPRPPAHELGPVAEMSVPFDDLAEAFVAALPG